MSVVGDKANHVPTVFCSDINMLAVRCLMSIKVVLVVALLVFFFFATTFSTIRYFLMAIGAVATNVDVDIAMNFTFKCNA